MDDEEGSRKAASATAASASASSTGRASTSGASPSSSATLGSSTASAPASMGIFYPLERDDSVSIIEEGEEHDLEADAFADMAMSGMDMNLEINTLNSVQIRAFLARNETSSENSGHFSAQASTAGCSNAEALQTEATKLSAYEVLRNGDVHYSRREDKMRALQEHPVVSSVASDGRTVGCKCGRNVRLNPPWYILKFEQHVASRNCTFLRQSRPRTKKRKLTDRRDAGAEEQQVNRRQEGLDSGSRSIPRTTDETEDSQDRDDDEFLGRDGKNETEEVGDEEGGMDDSDDYALQSLDRILRREFGVMKDGQRIIMPPADNSPEERIRMFKGAIVLRDNPQFKRITPDGRFAECECARIVLLGAPWQPGQFLMHVADKQKPKKRAKPASAAVTSAQWKKKRIDAATPRTLVSSGVLMSPPTSASVLVQANKSKKSFPREIRWDIARARGLLPCPGLRDERMDTFVSSAIQLTGGARHRQKIARELFPHLFPDSLEYSDEADAGSELNQPNGQSSAKKRQPKLQQLLEAEKLLLHDVIEGEALWFVDKDGNSGKEKAGPPRNPINRKFCSGRVCPLLEAEFDMQEPFARVLRDLALAEIPSGSGLNTWMQMATMGLSGDFNTHPALLGLTESMVRLKDKEQRGVGLQNMTYSDLLDTFMRSLADLSPEALHLATAGALNRDGSTGEPRDADSEEQMESDPGAVAFLTELGSPEDKGAGRIDDAVMPSDHVPCTGLRDENVQAVLSRSKTPRKLENIKYVPSVYTESDPFLRKLSKNSAFRGLYQTVKHMASPQSGDNSEVGAERLKEVHFWLRFARMGVFGHFKSHPVFEGLMKSMVEVKDKERRGVGKQNMQYSQALDDFMQGMAQISTEAFELFAAQFCGRTLRSQKVKRRSSNANPPVFSTTAQTSTSAAHGEENSTTHAPLPATLPPPQHQHYLIPPDDLLGGRSLSTEESQRFMDRMLDEVRLSASNIPTRRMTGPRRI
uniref:Uncharacterized protein n=1 Tax=Phytophthora ramorum TaxID=164328 RepID=H3GQ56_PHYRM